MTGAIEMLFMYLVALVGAACVGVAAVTFVVGRRQPRYQGRHRALRQTMRAGG